MTVAEMVDQREVPAAICMSEDIEPDVWDAYRGFPNPLPTAKDFDIPLSRVLKKSLEVASHIDIDCAVLGGTPRIAGTRIPVYMILDAIEYHGTLEGALKSYPQLTMDQVRDAVLFAASVLECSVDD